MESIVNTTPSAAAIAAAREITASTFADLPQQIILSDRSDADATKQLIAKSAELLDNGFYYRASMARPGVVQTDNFAALIRQPDFWTGSDRRAARVDAVVWTAVEPATFFKAVRDALAKPADLAKVPEYARAAETATNPKSTTYPIHARLGEVKMLQAFFNEKDVEKVRAWVGDEPSARVSRFGILEFTADGSDMPKRAERPLPRATQEAAPAPEVA